MPSSRGKVLLAMSGGVDSSVAAALLQRDGYEVVGCFMRLGSPGEALDELLPPETACRPLKIGHQGCCSINDAADARLVAAHLDIPFYIVNFKKDFGRIIDYFVDEYAAGRTPNPCVRCNDWLKFGKLSEYARQIGAEFVASGHYARIVGSGVAASRCEGGGEAGASAPSLVTPGRLDRSAVFSLRRAVDTSKDQSYVLFGIPRSHLAHTLFPLGDMRKGDVRDLARGFGLPVHDKPDSQEICFVPDNDYASLVERRRPSVARTGAILDESGNEVGRHDGQHRFTIGQRRGVGVALGHPIYVIDKDPVANTVTVGGRERLLGASCVVGEANWLVEPSALGPDWFGCFAKYRYNTPPARARARVLDDGAPGPSGRTGRFEVLFDEPQPAIAPGQAAVLYTSDDAVLGGGWIERVARA